jgi:hypothetical protein
LYAFLISPMCATRPTHLIILDLITLIIFGEAHKLNRLQNVIDLSRTCHWRPLRRHTILYRYLYRLEHGGHANILGGNNNGVIQCITLEISRIRVLLKVVFAHTAN